MPRFRRLGDGDIRAKTSATDLVTEADEAAERVITAGFARALPGCLVVGEEAATADPGLIAAMTGADLAVVVGSHRRHAELRLWHAALLCDGGGGCPGRNGGCGHS